MGHKGSSMMTRHECAPSLGRPWRNTRPMPSARSPEHAGFSGHPRPPKKAFCSWHESDAVSVKFAQDLGQLALSTLVSVPTGLHQASTWNQQPKGTRWLLMATPAHLPVSPSGKAPAALARLLVGWLWFPAGLKLKAAIQPASFDQTPTGFLRAPCGQQAAMGASSPGPFLQPTTCPVASLAASLCTEHPTLSWRKLCSSPL